MTADVDASEVRAVVEEVAAEEAEAIAREWYSAAQDAILQTDGAEEQEYETWPIAQSGLPPRQNGDGDWVFGFTHSAAHFLNDGTEPHVIRAREAEFLAFEWPEAPAEVQEMFEATFPTVFFKEINHPGTKAVRFMERSRDKVIGQ